MEKKLAKIRAEKEKRAADMAARKQLARDKEDARKAAIRQKNKEMSDRRKAKLAQDQAWEAAKEEEENELFVSQFEVRTRATDRLTSWLAG